MMKWIKIAALALTAIAVSSLSLTCTLQHRNIRTLRSQVSHQQTVIDSLLTMKRNSVNIELFVTDKSTNKIYGRYNRGTIAMPSQKSYTLEVDSAKIFR